eukprot:2699602-Prymnesium_polylepis.1
MPAERSEEDCYLAAGPVKRELSSFKGATPGPTDATFDKETTPQKIMETQVTAEFKSKWLQYTREHCFAYRRKYPERVGCGIERSMKHFYRKLKAAHFDLWIAVRLR